MGFWHEKKIISRFLGHCASLHIQLSSLAFTHWRFVAAKLFLEEQFDVSVLNVRDRFTWSSPVRSSEAFSIFLVSALATHFAQTRLITGDQLCILPKLRPQMLSFYSMR